MTTVDDNFCDIFLSIEKIRYDISKYHALFDIFEKAANLKLSSAVNFGGPLRGNETFIYFKYP